MDSFWMESLHIRINNTNIWTFTFYSQKVTSLTHQWFEHKYSFLIQPMVFAFTFYLLHSVNHFAYTLMIWMYGLFLDGSTGLNFYLLPFTLRNSTNGLCFYLLPFTFSKSFHIHINNMDVWTLFGWKHWP